MTAIAATGTTTGHVRSVRTARGTGTAEAVATSGTEIENEIGMSSRQDMKNAIESDIARIGMTGIVVLSRGRINTTDARIGVPIGENGTAAELYAEYHSGKNQDHTEVSSSLGSPAIFTLIHRCLSSTLKRCMRSLNKISISSKVP